MHTAKLLELSTDLPIVIEIVDAEEKIKAFLPIVDELVTEGLVTLEAVRVIKYAAGGGAQRERRRRIFDSRTPAPAIPEAASAPRAWLNRTTLGISLASLLSDISHELATAVLPAFLVSARRGAGGCSAGSRAAPTGSRRWRSSGAGWRPTACGGGSRWPPWGTS